MAEKSCHKTEKNSITVSPTSLEDYVNFVQKSLETQEGLTAQVLIENGMRAAKNASNVCKNNYQWNFKSIKDNFQVHQSREAKKGFLICDILDS